MLRSASILLLVIHLSGCADWDIASTTPADGWRSVPSPGVTHTPQAVPSPTLASDGEPATADPALAAGRMAAIVTTDLVVRSAPGVGPDSEIQPIRLSEPSVVYVVDGPVVADGYAWYLVDPVRPRHGLGDSAPAGWVAAGAKDGEAWIAPHEVDCQDDPTIEDLVIMAPQEALYCYRGQSLMVEAEARDCGSIVGSGLPWSSVCLLFVPGREPASIPQDCVDVCALWLEVWFDGLPPVETADPVSVTGHFDDAAAASCTSRNGDLTPLAVHGCRMIFVATSVRAS